MRIGHPSRRETGEVNIDVEINLDEPGKYEININSKQQEPNVDKKTINLFSHFYEQIYQHGFMSGYVNADGDLPHHVLEDLAMQFGKAIKEASEKEPSKDMKGIVRFDSLYVPFDGSLALVTIDYSGRGYSTLNFSDIDDIVLKAMAQHTFETMAREAGFNIYGYVKTIGTLRDDHHKLEAFYKAFGRVLHNVTRIYEPAKGIIPSTKGVL